jgi:membrane dipeptidase
MISRRSALGGGALVLAGPFIHPGRFRLFANTGREYSARTIELVTASTVIDMLGLMTLNYRRLIAWQTAHEEFPAQEFDRLKRSGVTILHPAVGFTHGDIHGASWSDLTRWNRFLKAYPDRFVRVDHPDDIRRAKESGKIGVILGLQNSAHFRTVEDVDRFYALGQRISQLTYYNNRLGGGCTDPGRGLTTYGADVVRRMNETGMAIDVSHCSDRTTLDAIEMSRKPVLVTHSNPRALVPYNFRCKTDEAIRKMAAKGGVLGITLVRGFVRASGPASVADVLQHINHVASVAGVEHVGLGTDVDLDGRDRGGSPKLDLDESSYFHKVYDVTEGLVRRKYSPHDIEAVLGGNFRRALGEIWKRQPAG